jgi:ATP-binding cassette subfamily C protein/ATP-binding cassette subfamily C protein LapB
MFFGTVAENIRVAMPLATDEEIWEVLDATGAREQVLQLPERLDTLIDTRNLHTLPASLMARLSVARALVKKARINLFDDSLHGLDSLGETVIMNAITRLRENKATVIMITHRPSHIRMADKLLILQEGNPVFFGPVANVPANRIRDFI